MVMFYLRFEFHSHELVLENETVEKENGIRILKYLNRNNNCMLYVL
jgi:hypothetical protein